MSRSELSLRRWLRTTAVLGAVAWSLAWLSPSPSDLRAAVVDPQGLVDRAGADALVLVAVPVLAWTCWLWATLGLLLTAASTAPGWAGRLAGILVAGLLPTGARRLAAVALGIGLSTVAPVVLAPAAPFVAVASAAAGEDSGEPTGPVDVDWPAPAGTPDWPAPSATDHVVLRGDCLWDIAAEWLRRQAPDAPATDAEVHRAVQAWWQTNAVVIGPDPDLLLPGQVLRPPG